MPTISLRLTEEQHEELKRWAHEDARSVQKEIIFRLFSPYVVHDRTPEERSALAYPLTAADAQPRNVPTRTIEQDVVDPFRRDVTPDWKKGK